MSQFDYIKEIAKHGLDNDREGLLQALNELIAYSKKTKKTNFALQLQSILKDGIRNQQTSGLAVYGSQKHIFREEDKEISEFVLEKLTSEYSFDNLICTDDVKNELAYFIEEHQTLDLLRKFDLPVSNKVILHGPSGCGKTLAAYVLAGELKKLLIVINLGAIVSSKLGETSKNLAKVFRRAATEDSIILLDEFDTLGKLRDYSQDHGEMKRIVNTILQLFDYLPQENIVIAATNHMSIIDSALIRRFDLQLKLDLPDKEHVRQIIDKTLQNGTFGFDNKNNFEKIISSCEGLSYFTIQKTLITAIKRSIFQQKKNKTIQFKPEINTELWLSLVEKEIL